MTDSSSDHNSGDNRHGLGRLPIGLLAVAALALVLLVAGGYGVIQQRGESEEEIRRLRAALATSATPAELRASREAALVLERENSELIARNHSLQTEAGRLIKTVADLETQLVEQEAALAVQPAKPKPVTVTAAPATPAPKPAAKPAPKKTAPAQPTAKPQVAATSGDWFVNFGSYGERAVAESWKKKLKPGAGQVITAASEKNGKTYYRVRVVNLADQDSAERVARALEKDYSLSKLWVGKQ